MSNKDFVEDFFPKSDIVSFLFITIPCFLIFFLIYKYGVNVITGDEWAIVPYIDKFFKGEISFKDILDFHNQHRIALPRILMLINSKFFGYNSKYQMFLGYFFTMLSFGVLYKSIENLLGEKFRVSHIIIPAFLIFSMRQWENFLYGWQFQIPMMVFLFLISLYSLFKSEGIDIYFAVSIISGIFTAYTFGNGILIWPIGFLLIAVKKRNKELYIWSLISIACLFFYFYGYPFKGEDDIYFKKDFLNFVLYFIVLVGSPLTTEKYTAFILGLILIFFYYHSLKSYKDYPFFASLIIFSLLSSFLIAISRSGFGWQGGIGSRYVSFSLLGPMGVYAIFLHKIYYKKEFNFNFFILLIFLFCFQIITSFSNYFKYELVFIKNKREEYLVKNYKKFSDFELNPDFSEIDYLKTINPELYQKIKIDFEKTGYIKKKYAEVLDKYSLNVFGTKEN
ncbi:MAG TPA: hypothetical protein PK103_07670 [Elusimicrobiales bacterium]|nr:hypothetical protein [Elusimicrobiales bacterium]HPO94892.1 hypothetical protein [Elusimicrobiales bacterium]